MQEAAAPKLKSLASQSGKMFASSYDLHLMVQLEQKTKKLSKNNNKAKEIQQNASYALPYMESHAQVQQEFASWRETLPAALTPVQQAERFSQSYQGFHESCWTLHHKSLTPSKSTNLSSCFAAAWTEIGPSVFPSCNKRGQS